MSIAIVAGAYGGPEVLEAVDVEVPDPGPGQVTVDVRGAGVNPWDCKSYSGAMGDDPAKLPLPIGGEVAGVVSAVGAGVPFADGDEVIGFRVTGGYAERLTVDASALVPKPASLDWAPAAGLMLVGTTAWHALEVVAPQAGETLLVHGVAGGVGRVVAQLALGRGVRVVGTAGTKRHDELRKLGVEPVAYGDGLEDRVREAAPEGVGAAVDCVGTDEAVDVSLAVVADRGRIVTIAAFGRAQDAGIVAIGSGPGADPGTGIRDAARPQLARLAGEGALTIPVAATFPLREAADAHRLVMEGHAGGKVVLLPTG